MRSAHGLAGCGTIGANIPGIHFRCIGFQLAMASLRPVPHIHPNRCPLLLFPISPAIANYCCLKKKNLRRRKNWVPMGTTSQPTDPSTTSPRWLGAYASKMYPPHICTSYSGTRKACHSLGPTNRKHSPYIPLTFPRAHAIPSDRPLIGALPMPDSRRLFFQVRYSDTIGEMDRITFPLNKRKDEELIAFAIAYAKEKLPSATHFTIVWKNRYSGQKRIICEGTSCR